MWLSVMIIMIWKCCRCGIGVAMENAIDDVKRLADEVCADNDADGVAGWLEQHILNAAKEA